MASHSQYEASIATLRASLIQISSSSPRAISTGENISLLLSMYSKLNLILTECKVAQKSELVANNNMIAIEEIFSTKNVILSKPMQTLISQIYRTILSPTNCPGYIVRNIFNSLLVIAASKSAVVGAKECIFLVLSDVLISRFSDCGSMVGDFISSAFKIMKASESLTKVEILSTVMLVIQSCGHRFSDTFADILKICSKWFTDKSVDMRLAIAATLEALAANSNDFASISSDALLALALKGLEDETVLVQNKFALAASAIFSELIRVRGEELLQIKQQQARGVDTVKEPTRKSSISKLTAAVTMKKKLLEEHDFDAVLSFMLKQCIKAVGYARAGYLLVVKYVIVNSITRLTKKEIDSAIIFLVETTKDPVVLSWSHEEIVLFRTRISYVIRSSILAKLVESDQISVCRLLLQYVSSNTELRNENEVQLALGELDHLVHILGEAIVPVQEEIHSACILLLRNPCFGNRMAAASVVSSIAVVIPVSAVGYLRDSLANAEAQAGHIAKSEGIDVDVLDSLSDVSHISQNMAAGSRRKSPRETERLQRLYFFHGQTLVISCILRSESLVPTGLPTQLVADILDMGIDLMRQYQRCPLPNRHVLCSLVRAGGHVVASCMAAGYSSVCSKLADLVSCCCDLLLEANSPSDTSKGDELMFEIIGQESALICIASLLWHYSAEISREGNVLAAIVEGLESAFRAMKGKYQQKFRQHFRFRALHVLLLECFSWLPGGSFAGSCQQVFVEALRVMRDSLSAGHECSYLNDFMHPEWSCFLSSGICRSALQQVMPHERPFTEDLLVLRLERNCTVLQKRESEAFLSSFDSLDLEKSNSSYLSAPCANLDARTIDAAINLVSKTLPYQVSEYQEKAVQLCSQALAQYVKAGSLSMFSSEEERKKRESKNYLVVKNIVCAVSAIVVGLPSDFVDGSTPLGLKIVDMMIEMLGNCNIDIRSASSHTIVSLVAKSPILADMVVTKLSSILRAALDKKSESLADFSGYIATICSFGNICNDARLKSLVQSILMESVQRVDAFITYRAFSLFALSIFVQSRGLGYGSQDMKDDMEFMSQLCRVVETQLVAVGTAYTEVTFNINLLLIALQKLVTCALSVVLYLDPSSPIVSRYLAAWDILQSSSTSDFLFRDNIEFIGCVLAHPINILNLEKTAEILLKGLRAQDSLACSVLRSVAVAVKQLVVKDTNIVCSTGLDLELFRCLEYSIRGANKAKHDLWWGIELNRGLDDVTKGYDGLQRDIFDAIECLVGVQIQKQPEVHSVRWVLFFRALALNLRYEGAEGETGEGSPGRGARDDGDEEPDNAVDDDYGLPSTTVQPSVGGDAGGTMTIVQFVHACRDKSIQKASQVSSLRSRMKSIILKHAVMALLAMSCDHAHYDLVLARKRVGESLASGQDSNNLVESAPLFASFYVSEIINFACACATFTIDDKPLWSVQVPSVHLLAAVCLMYSNFTEPDLAVSTTVDPTCRKEKFLDQYISQIISAVRPCISSRWTANLQWHATSTIFHLFVGGFIRDKILIKRLVKLIVTAYSIPDVTNLTYLRPIVSIEVAEEVAAIEHIVTSANLAKMFLITLKSSYFGEIDSETFTAVRSFFEPDILAHLQDIWYAVCVDAARVLQGSRLWPPGTIEVDCRRGGMLYSPDIKVSHLQRHLELALPACLAAASMQKNLSREKMAAIYSVARFALSDVQSDKRRNIACRNLREERRITSIDSNIRGVVEVEVDTIVLLGVFSSLAGHTEGSTPAIPIEEWVTLLRYIIFDMSSVGEFTRGSTKNCCVEAIVDVLDKICDYVLGENCSEEYESLWLWLWVAAVTFLHRSLQDFFTFTDAAEIVEQLGAD